MFEGMAESSMKLKQSILDYAKSFEDMRRVIAKEIFRTNIEVGLVSGINNMTYTIDEVYEMNAEWNRMLHAASEGVSKPVREGWL